MKVKTLLLGSAAAFAVVGGAQAADLSIVEPIDYVRVCDAMGTGFWYIPGTDTCIRIGGQVQFTANFDSEGYTLEGGYDLHEVIGTDPPASWNDLSNVVEFDDSDNEFEDSHHALWNFETLGEIEVEAKSMTEYGVLTAFIQLRGESDNAQQPTVTDWYVQHDDGPDQHIFVTMEQVDVERIVYLREAYLELGFLKAGYFPSTFRGAADYVGDAGVFGEYRPGDDRVDQVLLSWQMAGFAMSFGIEDPRDRFGTDLPTHYELPTLVAVLEAEVGPFDNRLSGAIAERGGYWNDTTSSWHPDFIAWGVNAQTTIDLSSIGSNALRVSAYFGNDSEFVDEIVADDEDYFNWHIFGSWRHDITPDVQFNLTGGYAHRANNSNRWEAMGDVIFDVTSMTSLALGGGYASNEGWAVGARVAVEPVPDQFSWNIRARYHENGDWDGRFQATREF
jgi:hypothetical protein